MALLFFLQGPADFKVEVGTQKAPSALLTVRSERQQKRAEPFQSLDPLRPEVTNLLPSEMKELEKASFPHKIVILRPISHPELMMSIYENSAGVLNHSINFN